MTNSDIETFWAVVQHGTMTAAAESLYITQPTLSMRIRALEERVGTPLFVRGKGQRRIALTEAGQKFLTLAQRWQQMLAETESLAELGQRAYLRMAATYTTNQYILPPVYKRFLTLRLPVSLWIHTLRDVDIAQSLLNHELDFAFIDSSTVFDDRLGGRPGHRRGVPHRKGRQGLPLYGAAAGPGQLPGHPRRRAAFALGAAIFAGAEGPSADPGQRPGLPVKKAQKNVGAMG